MCVAQQVLGTPIKCTPPGDSTSNNTPIALQIQSPVWGTHTMDNPGGVMQTVNGDLFYDWFVPVDNLIQQLINNQDSLFEGSQLVADSKSHSTTRSKQTKPLAPSPELIRG